MQDSCQGKLLPALHSSARTATKTCNYTRCYYLIDFTTSHMGHNVGYSSEFLLHACCFNQACFAGAYLFQLYRRDQRRYSTSMGYSLEISGGISFVIIEQKSQILGLQGQLLVLLSTGVIRISPQPSWRNKIMSKWQLKFKNKSQVAEEEGFDYSEREQWLRAVVLGANDGLVSVGSLMMGVGAVTADAQVMILTGFAGLVSGACSMALGELYLSTFN